MSDSKINLTHLAEVLETDLKELGLSAKKLCSDIISEIRAEIKPLADAKDQHTSTTGSKSKEASEDICDVDDYDCD